MQISSQEKALRLVLKSSFFQIKPDGKASDMVGNFSLLDFDDYGNLARVYFPKGYRSTTRIGSSADVPDYLDVDYSKGKFLLYNFPALKCFVIALDSFNIADYVHDLCVLRLIDAMLGTRQIFFHTDLVPCLNDVLMDLVVAIRDGVFPENDFTAMWFKEEGVFHIPYGQVVVEHTKMYLCLFEKLKPTDATYTSETSPSEELRVDYQHLIKNLDFEKLTANVAEVLFHR